MQKINETIKNIGLLDAAAMERAQERLDSLTKPQGSLGRLEELAKQLVGITGKERPESKNKVIFTLAADHGIAEEGVSAFPQEVTEQMVYNFLAGGAGINVLARHAGARVVIVDMGVKKKLKVKSEKLKVKKIDLGTKNFLKEKAMTREQAIRGIEAGIEVFEEEFRQGVDVAGTGEMGIANTTSASAITAAFTGAKVEEITGRGTGIDNSSLARKVKVIEQALKLHRPDPKDALDVLSKVGGFEIAGLSGIILAAAARRIPVVVDGFISGAAALIAYHLEPKTKDYMIAAHCSVEKGHRIILEHIGIKPLLDLNLRLGEGTGAALAMTILDASLKIFTEMASFKDAGVSEEKK
ncbi:MAG: nicotinate-nucleotide--dimethylbenzimidazole phosphoribosyltransferase [Candidatus Omnitrophica bacterium]|nr:nicotinate-nucleotide--dimethylbenzimidazole phosphoribosyltransferase [Candidatus Omnitrophota bacterium]MBU4478527.1 nicotinate-nucleotide--dimethylbenzimidazole phosphoribosyltransferase [Candidatus Omnitrophota bacterium]MCG2702935.1 nicotinate-nucleotide--dimethylbenzimidazole phosphoribosyltransferase [Candidatus Omnitrophota bacterium]